MTDPQSFSINPANPQDVARAIDVLQNRIAGLERDRENMGRFAVLMCAALAAIQRGELPAGDNFGTALSFTLDAFQRDPELSESDTTRFAQLLVGAYTGKIGGPVPLPRPRSRDHLRVVRPEDLSSGL